MVRVCGSTGLGSGAVQPRYVLIFGTRLLDLSVLITDCCVPMAGVSYDAGRGVVKDESKAVQWWQAAAAQDNAQAQHNLGLCVCRVL